MLEQDIYTVLSASTNVTVIGNASTRIYPITLPQNTVYPAVTYQRISGSPDYALSGHTGKEFVQIQIDAWTTSYSATKTLASMLRKAMEASTLYDAMMDGEQDIYEAEGQLYRISQDYSCWALTT